jgi:hypothetical protein
MQGWNSEIFDGGFVFHQNGNVVPNWVGTLAFIALKALLAAERHGFTADGADNDFEQVGRDGHGRIVAGQLSVASRQLSVSRCTEGIGCY